jgi:hypothetical protein
MSKRGVRELRLLPVGLVLLLVVLLTSPGAEDRRAVDRYLGGDEEIAVQVPPKQV